MPSALGFSFELNWQQFMWYFNQNIVVIASGAAIAVAIALVNMVANAIVSRGTRSIRGIRGKGTRSRSIRGKGTGSRSIRGNLTTDTTPRAAPADPQDQVFSSDETTVSTDLTASGFYEIANRAMSEGRVSFDDIARVTEVAHTSWAEKAQEILANTPTQPTQREEQKNSQDDQRMAQPDPTPGDPGEAQRKAAITRRINRWRQLVDFLNVIARRASLMFSQLINRSRRERLPGSIPAQVVTPQDVRGSLVVVRDLVQEPAIDPEIARRGRIVRVLGADPRKKYDLRYEVVELSTLVASNTATGAINPDYPAELQPRDRGRVASRVQIQHIAAGLEPDALLSETHSLDRGAMIVGPDGVVESGNGRTLALRLAAEEHPEKYEQYRARLAEVADEYGIDPTEVELMDQPVLVRRRMTDVDRVEFSRQANQSAILEMGAAEHARSDAELITTDMLMSFEMSDQSVEDAIRASKNRGFVAAFVGGMEQNARGRMIDETGNLSQEGVRRIAGAMLERVFPGSNMSARLFEDIDNDIRNVTSGIMRGLGPLARVEEMAGTGQRGGDLLLADDIAAAVEKMSSLKSTGLDVPTYLAQGQMFERELTPAQEDILSGLFERRRSAKAIGEWIGEWADLVERSPDPRQGSLFGPAQTPSKAELLGRWGQFLVVL